MPRRGYLLYDFSLGLFSKETSGCMALFGKGLKAASGGSKEAWV
jgi:hypothetical protein